jgi:hypothetical protein
MRRYDACQMMSPMIRQRLELPLGFALFYLAAVAAGCGDIKVTNDGGRERRRERRSRQRTTARPGPRAQPGRPARREPLAPPGPRVPPGTRAPPGRRVAPGRQVARATAAAAVARVPRATAAAAAARAPPERPARRAVAAAAAAARVLAAAAATPARVGRRSRRSWRRGGAGGTGGVIKCGNGDLRARARSAAMPAAGSAPPRRYLHRSGLRRSEVVLHVRAPAVQRHRLRPAAGRGIVAAALYS